MDEARNVQQRTAVIYARYSSERQNEQSIDGQIRIINQFAEKEGYTIIDTYIDRALTGRNDDRPSFQKMIADSSNKAFQYVIVYKLDRFSRNRYDSAVYKKKLKDNGVRVISATENITDTPEGVIMESILEGYSEYYSKELAQKIIRGNYESRSKGQYTGGAVIYGYRIDQNKKYVVNKEEAEIVRKIFSDVANHKKIVDIVSDLKGKGIPYKDGEEWSLNGVARMLRNEKYKGIAKFGELVYDNIVPAIVTEEDFDEVRKELEKHKHKTKANLVDYKFLLSDKVYCGDCGKLLNGHTGTSRTGKTYHYYKCRGTTKHECHQKPIRKEELEDMVVDAIFDFVLSPEIITPAAKRMVGYFNAIGTDENQIKILEDALKEVERKLKNSLNAVANGVSNKSVVDMITNLEEDKEKLNIELLKLKSKKRIKLTFDNCYQFLLSLAFYDTKKEKNRERLINALVKKVYVIGNRIKIVFYPTADMGSRNYNDGTGGASGPGSLDGESGETSMAITKEIGGSLGSASRPPNCKKTNSVHIIGIYYATCHFVIRAKLDIVRNRKKK